MRLEVAARQYISNYGIPELDSYVIKDSTDNNLKAKEVLLCMIEDRNADKSIEEIAAKFHLSLVNWIADVALSEKCESIAFSGGVFQNAVLIDLIHQRLTAGFKLYFHKDLSPNDENISFGQFIYFKMTQKLAEKN